jgi:hypothetical protein
LCLLGKYSTTWATATVLFGFFFLTSSGIWTWGLALARQALYYLSHTSNLIFCFWDRVSH